jgi:hypothetical protein
VPKRQPPQDASYGYRYIHQLLKISETILICKIDYIKLLSGILTYTMNLKNLQFDNFDSQSLIWEDFGVFCQNTQMYGYIREQKIYVRYEKYSRDKKDWITRYTRYSLDKLSWTESLLEIQVALKELGL